MDDTDYCIINGCTYGGMENHEGRPLCLVCGEPDRMWSPGDDDDEFTDTDCHISRYGGTLPENVHAPDCAIALNGRHACSCKANSAPSIKRQREEQE